MTPARSAASWCTCGARRRTLHAATCMTVAVTQPHAMTGPDGEVFYPDDRADAVWFHRLHDAVPVNPDVWPFGDVTSQQPDDPAPTTGGPVEYEWAEGCVCYLRDDADWGEHLVPPRAGCRVHTPWAFPGYSLTAEDAGIFGAVDTRPTL